MTDGDRKQRFMTSLHRVFRSLKLHARVFGTQCIMTSLNLNTNDRRVGLIIISISFQTAKKAFLHFLLNFFSNRDEGFFMGFDLW